MRFLFFYFMIFCFLDVMSQSSDLIIKTNRPFIGIKNIHLFSQPDETELNNIEYEIDHLIFGNIKIYFYSDNVICFRIKHDLPIMISGLNNLNEDKIKISKIPRVKYNPIDSLWSSTISYYNKDSLDHSSIDTTIYTSNKSTNKEIELMDIRINGASYTPIIKIFPSEYESTYCTPGEFSTTQYVKKVNKFFHYTIRKN